MTWWEAADVARSGKLVRRAVWRDRWISYERGLWFLTPVNPVTLGYESRRVVLATDFGVAEFLATDWTTAPILPIRNGVVAFPAFNVAIVRFRWEETAGNDLDIRVALLGTGNVSVDGVDLGYSRAEFLPPTGDRWISWGLDNTDPAGLEAIAIDFRQILTDVPGAAEVRARLRAYWWALRLAGDFDLEIETFDGGVISPAGVNDLVCSGDQVSLVVLPQSATTQLEDAAYAGDEIGALVYDPMVREAVYETA